MASFGNPSYLATQNPHERDSHITFDEGPHKYYIDGDDNYMSVTTSIHKHFAPFDADTIIARMMASRKWPQNKYFGMEAEEIKALWDKNRDEAAAAGTKLHYDIECFYNNMSVDNGSEEYKQFLSFYKSHQDKVPYRTEWMVWDRELRMAGSIDMTYVNDDGSIDIYDWKRSKEIKTSNQWQYATTECISHLPDTNFWHYSLQLNTYKALLERNYGKKINEMYLVVMHPNQKKYMRYKVPELSEEIKDLFKLREEQVKKIDRIQDSINTTLQAE